MNIIILGTLAFYKNSIGQRQHFLAKEFSKDNKVLFLESHDSKLKVDGDIIIDHCLYGDWFQNSYDVPKIANKLEQILSNFIDPTQKSVVIFEIPLSGYINVIPVFRKFKCKIHYDCIDNWRYFYGGRMIDTDRTSELIDQCDSISATAINLIKDLNNRFKVKNISYIANGYGDLENNPLSIPLDIDKSKINIAYVGALGEWYNHQFLYETAINNSNLCFHIFGNYSPRPEFGLHAFNNLVSLNNCHFYGSIQRSEIKSMMSKMDYGIIPFINSPLIECTDAIKAYEYLACNKKIIHPHYMAEMYNFPEDVRICYKNKEDLALLNKDNYINKEIINNFLRNNSWNTRYNKFMEVFNAL